MILFWEGPCAGKKKHKIWLTDIGQLYFENHTKTDLKAEEVIAKMRGKVCPCMYILLAWRDLFNKNPATRLACQVTTTKKVQEDSLSCYADRVRHAPTYYYKYYRRLLKATKTKKIKDTIYTFKKDIDDLKEKLITEIESLSGYKVKSRSAHLATSMFNWSGTPLALHKGNASYVTVRQNVGHVFSLGIKIQKTKRTPLDVVVYQTHGTFRPSWFERNVPQDEREYYGVATRLNRWNHFVIEGFDPNTKINLTRLALKVIAISYAHKAKSKFEHMERPLRANLSAIAAKYRSIFTKNNKRVSIRTPSWGSRNTYSITIEELKTQSPDAAVVTAERLIKQFATTVIRVSKLPIT